jgi:hypothetical protein
MKAILFLLTIGFAVTAAAQTYKWSDERGVTTYGSKPPPGVPAQLVDTQPRGPAELSPTDQKKVEDEARRRAAIQPPPPPPTPPVAVAPPLRGMAFDTYIRLERGMSEGELVLRAGSPDHVSTEDAPWGFARLYYYMPTATDPFTTVVTLRGGRIERLERTRKF